MIERVAADRVRASFDGCDASMVADVALAILDQIAADGDADIAVLDAMGDLLADALVQAHRVGVSSLAITAVADELIVEFSLDAAAGSDVDLFGDALDDIEMFFAIARPRADCFLLTGSLR